MTPKHPHRSLNDFFFAFKRSTYVIPVFMLTLGFLLGATFIKITKVTATDEASTKTVTVLIHDGVSSRVWNGVTLNEGDSVAMLIDRIATIEGIPLSWSGTGRERQIASLMGKDDGVNSWHAYIDNAPLPTSIGKFYPKPGQAVTLIYAIK